MLIKIKKIASYLPKKTLSNAEIIALADSNQLLLNKKVLSYIGCETRYRAEDDENASDLATKAAEKILTDENKEEIDLLIFASASSDFIEPATANPIQQKLGLRCPVMDIKNACNSFVNALQVASSFIEIGVYKNILIVTGEKPSVSVKYHIKNLKDLKKYLAGFTLSDGGSAAIITSSNDESKIHYQKFYSIGSEWKHCSIRGGGTWYPRDPEKSYFEGDTIALKNSFDGEATEFLKKAMKDCGCDKSTIKIYTHQVSEGTYDLLIDGFNIKKEQIHRVFHLYGNMAAASIPVSMVDAIEKGILKRGDKILLIGLAAGISASLQYITF